MTDPIFTRVSVREFRDLPVDDALITRLLKAAMQAPSAGDQRPWEFWVVTDPKTKEALSLASPYAEAAAKATSGEFPAAKAAPKPHKPIPMPVPSALKPKKQD